jgi:hypothetical protein
MSPAVARSERMKPLGRRPMCALILGAAATQPSADRSGPSIDHADLADDPTCTGQSTVTAFEHETGLLVPLGCEMTGGLR